MRLIITFFAMIFCTIAMAQLPVSHTPEKKRIVLEEYAGIHCQYCPEGHMITNDIEAAHGENAFFINVHTGSFANPGAGDPDFRTSFGPGLAGQTGLSGYPSATINRHLFSGINTALNRSQWAGAANSIRNDDAYVNVAVEADINAQTRLLTVNVELYYTDDAPVATNNINVALTQSNIIGFQGNLNENPAQVTEDGQQYIHNHALRHMITGQWGEEITTISAGTTVSKTYTYTLPTIIGNLEVDMQDLEVVAFVAEGRQEIINGGAYHPTISNFAHDVNAGIDEFHVPAIACENEVVPVVSVRNNGNDAINILRIEYSANGGPVASELLTGLDITPGHTMEIELPAIEYVPDFSNMAAVTITKVNGNPDELASDDAASASFDKLVSHYTRKVDLELITDQWASETSWKFVDGISGNVLHTSDSYPDLATSGTTSHEYSFNVFYNRCYYFEILDYYGDGLCSGYGNGRFELSADGRTILEGCDIGAKMSIYFATDPTGFDVNTTSAAETHPTTEGDPTVHNVLTPNILPMTLRWYLVDLDVPAGWDEEVAVCDDVECHVSTLTTFEYTVTESGGTALDVHFINNNLEGVGTARLLVYDVNDSAATAIYVDFEVTISDATGILNHNVRSVDVYPNPTTSALYIKGLSGTDIGSIEVFNAIGELVLEEAYRFADEQQIDVSGFESGMYMLRMYDRDSDTWLTQSFMKQ